MKRNIILYFPLFLLIIGCSNQSWSDQFNNRGIKNGDIKLLENKSSFTFNSSILPNKPILCPITIKGIEANFLLDTGISNGIYISESFSKKAGIDNILYTTSSFMGDTKMAGPVQVVIGPFSIRQSEIGIVKDNTFSTEFEGMFGFSVLKYFTLKINPDSQTVTFSIASEKSNASLNLLPRKDGKIRTKVSINNSEFIAVLDTGNSGANYISSKFDLNEYLNDYPNKVILSKPGSKLSNWSGTLSDFYGLAKIETKLRNQTLSAELNYFVTSGSYYILDGNAVNLGMEFVSSFITTIDYNNWTISIEPIKKENNKIKTYDPIFLDKQGEVIAILNHINVEKISIGDTCTKIQIRKNDFTNYQLMKESGHEFDLEIDRIKF